MLEPTTVLKTDEGVKLLRWFLRYYQSLPKSLFYKMCRGGQIRVNSSRCRGAEVLIAGDKIRIPPNLDIYKTSPSQKTGGGDEFSLSDLESLRKTIIFNDDDIVAFNKPAGLATQGGSGIKKSIDKMAAALFPYDKISLVHRLDKDTSGLLIVAKNHNSAVNLSAQFADKTASKKYLALLLGCDFPKNGLIDNMMVRGKILSDNEKVPLDLKPVRAITEYRTIANLPNGMSFVLFSPKTGRTHQLRLHSAFSLDAPIVGDSLYGGSEFSLFADNKIISKNNLFLFAYKLSFRHPTTGKILTLQAAPPEFIKVIIDYFKLEIPA